MMTSSLSAARLSVRGRTTSENADAFVAVLHSCISLSILSKLNLSHTVFSVFYVRPLSLLLNLCGGAVSRLAKKIPREGIVQLRELMQISVCKLPNKVHSKSWILSYIRSPCQIWRASELS